MVSTEIFFKDIQWISGGRVTTPSAWFRRDRSRGHEKWDSDEVQGQEGETFTSSKISVSVLPPSKNDKKFVFEDRSTVYITFVRV